MSSSLSEFLYYQRYLNQLLRVKVDDIRTFTEDVLDLLYPQRGKFHFSSEEQVKKNLECLKINFKDWIQQLSNLKTTAIDAQYVMETFFSKLPLIANLLDQDVQAAFEGDPAAYSLEEIIICYPGFFAIAAHRLAHTLYQLNLPIIPRLISEYAHEKTGIDIHPGARIGERFFIDHGTGVVIGETTIIGKNVKIYQGVTLGALSVKKRLQSVKRHPTIEDDVVIYANSTILGGETIIGKGSVIGGNVWLTQSVAPYSKIFNQNRN